MSAGPGLARILGTQGAAGTNEGQGAAFVASGGPKFERAAFGSRIVASPGFQMRFISSQ